MWRSCFPSRRAATLAMAFAGVAAFATPVAGRVPGADQLNGGPATTPTPTPTPTVGAELGSGKSLLKATYNMSNGVAARMQWNANDGYCGETSFITALMLNGGYTSQWTARSLGGGKEWKEGSQLLLGSNDNGVSDKTFADKMRLKVEDYDGAAETNTDQFLSWIKKKFLADALVIIGVYNNVKILGEGPGDHTYDHIVPVTGIGSNHPLDADDSTYYKNDLITLSDNGLYTPVVNYVPGNSPENPAQSALYTFKFDDWQRTRAGANKGSDTYHLYSAPIVSESVQNYGTAVTGIVDESTGGPQVIPVKVSSNLNGEGFQDGNTLKAAPAAQPMTLTATAHPTPGTAYNVYIYEDFACVPRGNFNSAPGASEHLAYTIPSTNTGTWTQSINITTADTRIFRIVPKSAP